MRARRAPGRGLAALLLLCLLLAGAMALAVRYPDALVLRLQAPADGAPAEPGTGAGDGAGPGSYRPPGETAFLVIEQRPLFAPDRRPPEEEPPAAGSDPVGPASLDGLALTGIVGAGAQRVAIVEPAQAARGGQAGGEPLSLRVGDELRGWTVEAVEADRIILANGPQTHEMELVDDPARRRRTAPRPSPAPGAPLRTPRQPVPPQQQ